MSDAPSPEKWAKFTAAVRRLKAAELELEAAKAEASAAVKALGDEASTPVAPSST